MGTPYGPKHAMRGYPPQTYRGRHSRPDTDPAAGSPLPWLVGIGTLLLTVVLLAVAVPNSLLSTEFDELAVQRGVAQVLTDSGYIVVLVSCPAGQPVEVGHSFDCRASIDGQQRDVTITVRTSGGEYEVGAPR
ncbi:MAG: DUF4333 domain-containing protein [Pseudonocardiaceae bacterium]|nr:DUF4333 domain-containing protein [Pseudonocardiaceae bacterium]